MKNYEIMFIVKSSISENEVKEVANSFLNVLTTNGAKLSNPRNLGQRELAYEIKGNKSGFYFVCEVECNDDKAIKEFDRLALINSNIIRHLITKIEQ